MIKPSEVTITYLLSKPMALKSLLLFVSLLVAVGAAPVAKAQEVLSIRVTGTVPCALGSTGVGFPNATVNFQCGAANVISVATTDSNGQFAISVNSSLLPSIITTVASLLTNCNLVVNTTLSTCNPTLPASGVLVSLLRFVRDIVEGTLNITEVVPVGFGFRPNL